MQQRNVEYEGTFTSFTSIFMHIAIQVCIDLEIYINNKTILMTREKKEKKKSSMKYFSSITNPIQFQ